MPTRIYSTRTLAYFALAAFTVVSLVQLALTPGLIARFHPLPVDQGPAWYTWQLQPPSTAGRISAWIGYAAHQIVVFVLLYAGRSVGSNGNGAGTSEKTEANRFNLLVLTTNVGFIALHLLQTQLYYDALAQDVPIWTSQGSVIVMLVLMLFLEMPRRGLFFGKWRKVPKRTYGFVRRFHGFYIAWAIVYTFWFHPMEGTWGLMSGFIYMFLLFIQLSLFRTKLHTNGPWIVLLEAGVIIHATLITVYKDNPIWPMFLFGFLAMFSFTQVYGLTKSRALRIGALVLYIGGAALVYGLIRGFNHLYELSFIPVALYGGTVALWLVGTAIEAIAARRSPKPAV